MQLRKKRKLEQSYLRKATVLIQSVVFGSAVGVGIAALAVDTGLMYGAKQELQNAADAAALAAASQLGETQGASTLALAEAVKYTGLNKVTGEGGDFLDTDFVLGHAVMNGDKFDFIPETEPYDAVRVTVRRDASVADGPVNLFFSRTFGIGTASLTASATAMLVPRDISLVIDLSASMNDDSELRHYKDFGSESSGGGTRDGVQINLEDIWLMLPQGKGNAGVGNGYDPPPPGNPHSENDHPVSGPGEPINAGGNPSPGATGASTHEDGGAPRWGWMTAWGDEIVLGSYTPVGDYGLAHIPKGSTCTDADVIQNLTQAGYTENERLALLSGSNDGTTEYYQNRVKVMLGLTGWKSKKKIGTTRDSKYNGGPGNGDDVVESNELTQETDYPFNSGTWDSYINYVRGSSAMKSTDANFRYRYGLKTVTNYLLEKKPKHSQTEELWQTPEEPLHSVKNAVQTMIDTIIDLESADHVSLELFASTGRHGSDLEGADSPELLAEILQEVPDTLNTYQAGHYSIYTNIAGGIDEAIHELSNGQYGAYNDGSCVPHSRARSSAIKVIIMLTDGKPNRGGGVGGALASADVAKSLGMTLYTVGVGGDVNAGLCEDMASVPENYFFADNTPDPENDGQPMYVRQLQTIFETLGGKRPVRLIQ